MNACPKCRGTKGYEAKLVMNYSMAGVWGEDWETTGTEYVVYKSKSAKCMDCGHRVPLDEATGVTVPYIGATYLTTKWEG